MLVWVAVRAPFLLLLLPADPPPDGAEYLSIACHLASGDGAVTSIKPQRYDRKPVLRLAIGDRALLYPAMVAAGRRVFGLSRELLLARLTDLVVSGAACVLCLLLFSQVFGWRVGFIGSLLAEVAPWHVITGVEPLSDELYLLRPRPMWGNTVGSTSSARRA